MTSPIKVSIVEDSDKIRQSLALLIDGAPGFTCISAHATVDDACERIPHMRPDVVLMDINLGSESGIDCVIKLRSLLPCVKIVMHTVYEDANVLFKSLSAGAHGYLLKGTPPAKLLEALADVLHGSSPMSGQMARMVVEYFHQRGTVSAEHERLTDREREILEQLTKGYRNKEIAEKMGLGFDTVRAHLRNIYEKLHVSSRAEAVAKYLTK